MYKIVLREKKNTKKQKQKQKEAKECQKIETAQHFSTSSRMIFQVKFNLYKFNLFSEWWISSFILQHVNYQCRIILFVRELSSWWKISSSPCNSEINPLFWQKISIQRLRHLPFKLNGCILRPTASTFSNSSYTIISLKNVETWNITFQ